MAGLRRKITKGVLRAYKLTLSPLFAVFGAQCRHSPSCSEYMAESVSRHGVWPGLWMGVARLSRCRPGGSSGYDPAPMEKKTVPFWAPWQYGDWNPSQRVVAEFDPPPNDSDKD